MKQTEHKAELAVLIFFKHTAQVKLYVGQFDQLSGIADKTQGYAIADYLLFFCYSFKGRAHRERFISPIAVAFLCKNYFQRYRTVYRFFGYSFNPG